ncbi:hypothetical protein BSIN_4730 [Burkholderia singularis]|uniref:Uncharacterized protein n=1 Tax=Burkholderia singularis TaxID=1503053 RepID=A0A238H9Y1_9BURK|nr:hypothetical protein BSIN_4730 [Burkholderia singularis]
MAMKKAGNSGCPLFLCRPSHALRRDMSQITRMPPAWPALRATALASPAADCADRRRSRASAEHRTRSAEGSTFHAERRTSGAACGRRFTG